MAEESGQLIVIARLWSWGCCWSTKTTASLNQSREWLKWRARGRNTINAPMIASVAKSDVLTQRGAGSSEALGGLLRCSPFRAGA